MGPPLPRVRESVGPNIPPRAVIIMIPISCESRQLPIREITTRTSKQVGQKPPQQPVFIGQLRSLPLVIIPIFVKYSKKPHPFRERQGHPTFRSRVPEKRVSLNPRYHVPDAICSVSREKPSRVKTTKTKSLKQVAHRLTTETVEGAALALERVDNVEGRDGLALGVLSVGNRVADDALEEGLEDTTGLVIDHYRWLLGRVPCFALMALNGVTYWQRYA